jgi:elongation factor P
MITAGQFKKGMVITFEGAHWTVEDYHIQKTAQRRPVLHTKLRHLKNGHMVERAFDEGDRFEQPDVQSRSYQFLYADRAAFVFMDAETYDQITIPEAIVGNGKWLLKEGNEFLVRLIDGQPAQIVLPPTFTDEVVETAEPSSSIHSNNVQKDARLGCGLVIKVPLFIKVRDQVKVDTENHKYHGKESAKH